MAVFDILMHPVYVKLILGYRAHYFMNILFETFFYVVDGLDAKELLQSFGTHCRSLLLSDFYDENKKKSNIYLRN